MDKLQVIFECSRNNPCSGTALVEIYVWCMRMIKLFDNRPRTRQGLVNSSLKTSEELFRHLAPLPQEHKSRRENLTLEDR
jgi:hypothetical protein